jgi:hypothetical protein
MLRRRLSRPRRSRPRSPPMMQMQPRESGSRGRRRPMIKWNSCTRTQRQTKCVPVKLRLGTTDADTDRRCSCWTRTTSARGSWPQRSRPSCCFTRRTARTQRRWRRNGVRRCAAAVYCTTARPAIYRLRGGRVETSMTLSGSVTVGAVDCDVSTELCKYYGAKHALCCIHLRKCTWMGAHHDDFRHHRIPDDSPLLAVSMSPPARTLKCRARLHRNSRRMRAEARRPRPCDTEVAAQRRSSQSLHAQAPLITSSSRSPPSALTHPCTRTHVQARLSTTTTLRAQQTTNVPTRVLSSAHTHGSPAVLLLRHACRRKAVMCVCACLRERARARVLLRVRMCVSVPMGVRARARVRVCVRVRERACGRASACACVRACALSDVWVSADHSCRQRR